MRASPSYWPGRLRTLADQQLISPTSPRDAIGKRIGGLYIAQQFGNAFGGLLAAAVLKMEGLHGIHGWQVITPLPPLKLRVLTKADRRPRPLSKWLFIIEGAVTVGAGFTFAFIMPECKTAGPLVDLISGAVVDPPSSPTNPPPDPYNAKILSPVERDLAVWRIERETGAAEGSGPTESVVRLVMHFSVSLPALITLSPSSPTLPQLSSFKNAFTDPKLYMLIFMNMCVDSPSRSASCRITDPG